MQKALYRAYRPQTFDEVVGQDAIVTALKNQIMTGQIGHAYLFAGTRGTGKTSCAKIFARAVNCLDSHDGNPCNACAHCRAILDETTMDVVEMDAASNRGIDDIRELRETVIYPPAQVRYKVYIIDEAHMITKEAFNALLKIMEEPPSHLIFILATTEPERIPATILSRVQRYEFKRIEPEVIAKRLAMVAEEQQLRITPEALQALALAANGALRDALSLLDQVMAMGETTITEEVVDRVLGTAGWVSLEELTRDVLADRLTAAMAYAHHLLEEGKEAGTLISEWMQYFQQLLLVKGGGASLALPIAKAEREAMEAMVADVALSRLLDSIDVLVETDVLLRKSDAAETLFLATVARLVDYTSPKRLESRLAAVEAKLQMVERWQSPEKAVQEAIDKKWLAAGPPAAIATPAPASQSAPAPQPKSAPTAAPKPQPTPTPAPQSASTPQSAPTPTTPSSGSASAIDPLAWYRDHASEWRKFVVGKKIVAPFFLDRFDKIEVSRTEVFVTFAPENAMHEGVLKGKEKELSEALSEFTGKPWKVHIGEVAHTTPNSAAPAKVAPPATAAPSPEKVPEKVPEKAQTKAPEKATETVVQPSPAQEKAQNEDWTWQELQRVIPPELLEKK